MKRASQSTDVQGKNRLTHLVVRCVVKAALPLLMLHRLATSPRFVATALCCAMSVECAAVVEQKRSYNLPSGDAATTVNQFAAVSGLQIIFMMEKVRGVRTNAVAGNYTAHDALNRMLAGTALEAAQDIATGTFVVSRKRSAEDASPDRKVGTGSNLHSNSRPKSMNKPRTLLAAFAGWLSLGTVTSAQTATPPTQNPPQSDEQNVVMLSPFVINASADVGYQARETLAGGRLRMQLKDVSAQVDIMTEEFLSDLGVNSLEDALKYSLSVDSQSDWYEPGGSDTLGANPFNPSAGNRARGLARASTSVGFFETSTAIDSYNTERYSFVGGPNAILFGNGMAGGSVDTSFKRAKTNRNKYSVSLQLDSDKGYRGTLDINQVLLKDLLAVRFNSLKQDIPAGRLPSYDKSERYFGSISFEPLKRLRMLAYYESARIHKAPIRSTLVQDKVTPYLKALEAGSPAYTVGSGSSAITYPGRPAQPGAFANYLRTYDSNLLLPFAFDNSAINSFNISANTTANNNARIAQGFTSPVSSTPSTDILVRNTSSAPVLVFGGAATNPIPIMSWNNTSLAGSTPGAFVTGTGGDSFDWSFSDDSIYPAHINIVGNGLQQLTSSKIYGGIIEFNPVKNLFIEFGTNREFITYRFSDVLGSGNTELAIDLNRYLPAEWAPGAPMPTRAVNPNFGRYYVTSGVGGGENGQEKADDRLTATYTLDFKNNNGWSRWLGVHRLLGVWTNQMSQRFEQVRQGASGAVVLSDNAFTNSIVSNAAVPLPNALTNVRAATRQLQVRSYLGSPTAGIGGNPYVDLNVDPLNWGNVGTDVNGAPVIVSGENLPGGASAFPLGNGRKETEGLMFSLQSAFVQDRIILSYGRRRDENSFTSWLDGDMQPRYDVSNGGYYYPVAGTPVPDAYASAPWMSWQDFKKLGLQRTLRHESRQEESPTSVSKGIVVHPLNWLSVFYNESTSAYAAEFSLFNHDGTRATNDDGSGRDYGFAVFAPDGKFSARVNWFESTRTGGSSSFHGNSGAGRKSLRDNIYYVEKTFLNVRPDFDVAGDQYAYYSGKVRDASYNPTINAGTNFLGDSHPVASERGIFVQADRVAKGVEVTLTANPLPGLDLSLRAAQLETRDSKIGLNWFQFTDDRWANWESVATSPILNIPGQKTMKEFFQSIILPSLSYVKMSEGLPNPQERKYKVNFTARYTLQGGKLKGLFFGGNYGWRSKSVLGFATRPVLAEEVYREFAGIGAGGYDVPDFNTPYMGRPLTTLDGFLGYRRKIFKGKYEWSVQLNVRNLLDDQELIPQRVFGKKQSDGTTTFWVTNYNVPDPRRFILTNTITF